MMSMRVQCHVRTLNSYVEYVRSSGPQDQQSEQFEQLAGFISVWAARVTTESHESAHDALDALLNTASEVTPARLPWPGCHGQTAMARGRSVHLVALWVATQTNQALVWGDCVCSWDPLLETHPGLCQFMDGPP